MQIPQDHVRPGHDVRVRGALWRVADIQPCGTCRIVTLTGLTPPNLGATRRLLDPFDNLEPIDRSRAPRVVSARQWRRACRALIATDTPPGSVCAARSARIDLMPH